MVTVWIRRTVCVAVALLLAAAAGAEGPGAASTAGGMIPPDAITAESVAKLFQGAFLKARVDKDGDVEVEDEGVVTWIRVFPEKKLLSFFALFRFAKGAPREARLELVNTMNDKVVVARFCAMDSGTLYADYFLSFEEGLTPAQIVRAYRWFRRTAVMAIQKYDTEGLVE